MLKMTLRQTLTLLVLVCGFATIRGQMERIFEREQTILDQQAGTGKILIQSELKIDILFVPEECEKKGIDGDTLVFDYEAGINGEITESSKYIPPPPEEEGKEKKEGMGPEGMGKGEQPPEHSPEPLVVPLGRKAVIAGLESGVQQMCIGEKRKIVIPPHLAFGAKGVPGAVPENAYITFIVELIEIIPKSWSEWYVEMVWMACYVSFLGGIIALMYQKIQERRKERRKTKKRTKYDDYEQEHQD